MAASLEILVASIATSIVAVSLVDLASLSLALTRPVKVEARLLSSLLLLGAVLVPPVLLEELARGLVSEGRRA